MEENNNIECRRILVEDFENVERELDENPDVLEWTYWSISSEMIGIEITWKKV